MLTNFFSNTKPINYVLLAFLFLIIYIFTFAESNITYYTFGIVILKLVDFFLLFLVMFLYSFIIRKNKLTANNHFGILIFSLFFFIFYPILINTKLLAALVLLVLAFRRIYSLNIHNNLKNKLFDSGFLIALASLLFQENAFFIILVYFAILVFRHLKWNYLFIPITGFITPYFLIYIYSLSFNNWGFYNRIIKPGTSFNLNILDNHLILTYSLIIVLLSLFGYFSVTLKAKVFSNKFKALWILIFEHLILSIFILFTGKNENLYNSIFLIFPAGIILANYIQVISKNWVKEVFILLIVGLSFSRVIYSLVP